MPAVDLTDGVRCREATSSDIDFLTDVVIEATRQQGRWPADLDEEGFRTGHRVRSAREVEGQIPGSTTYVIEVDNVRQGRLRVVRDSARVELAGIQLLPRHQSHGVGTQVVRGLKNEAVASGRRFELSVEKDNPRARALYERLGLVWESETPEEDHLIWPPSD